MHVLDGLSWPAGGRFPFNRAGAHVREVVWADLVASRSPLIVAGYSSIDRLVAFIADWTPTAPVDGQVRLLLGAEPFPTQRRSFASAELAFTAEVRRYWLDERGISLHLSAKVLHAIAELDAGRLTARFVHGRAGLHAKIYLADRAATVGSSNFTDAGLALQLEANARFEQANEPDRYRELATIAEHLWSLGQPWDSELRALLEALLRVVSWQEALARACAELLEGEWAQRYLGGLDGAGVTLWPSQRAGIAEALWIAENVGSVLVADATGSGKTRMGAHLVRAIRDRLWATGRVRRDLTVLVCPPAVADTWRDEAVACGLSISTVSHGLLSRAPRHGTRVEQREVHDAQILAVDEAHNFLNRDANRTQQVRESHADHVALFTATPINRGAGDLLHLVGLLGADNFEDATLAVLRRLERARTDQTLNPAEIEQLRSEIQRFTVRRTKTMLNRLVDREPNAYLHPDTGRVCRYPRHDSRIYPTGETVADEEAATVIRTTAHELVGVGQLERHLYVPAALRRDYTDGRWLQFRLTSTAGLAGHHVLSAMRSSRAALVEHLVGTAAVAERFGLDARFKTADTGNVIAKLERLTDEGPPRLTLDCPLPEWLTDPDRWRAICGEEQARYQMMLDSAAMISDARERAKASLLTRLAGQHPRVLAFDHHLVTLAVLQTMITTAPGCRVVVATGGSETARKEVTRLFERTSTARAVALCSDAMNEGLNLQGASAIVHLDLPTTLRVAEQRVGRVDRMDSPHDTIEAWWPDDGPAFATRANELLVQRAAESEQLLGSNLPVPAALAHRGQQQIDVREQIIETETAASEPWDGIRDALDPVRRLVDNDDALIARDVYERHRHPGERILARVSPVQAVRPWAFLAVAGTAHGAPRWLFLPTLTGPPVTDLNEISRTLTAHLGDDPPGGPLDDRAVELLARFLTAATNHERLLLPRRMQRALDQLTRTTSRWATAARQRGDETEAAVWQAVGRLTDIDPDGGPDPYLVAERWLQLVTPTLEHYRDTHRKVRYVLLADIDRELANTPLPVDQVTEAFGTLPVAAPLAERVTACILGVPTNDPDQPDRPPVSHRHHGSQ